ncbi:rho GTPase-activating protein 4 isoform X2 [Anolis carolinensis]|uniref:rho GTPase-activating protein 4 isoform X2 n=1 Tax=Anolis carolinensis TaxID=28377 RepID=UPI0007DB74AC|nr:PREDICTED: rho GTPase-activating protein 4 isoform X2 [Anolis carolinensis]|eukprot:XP_008102151.2 PREDICTED: rho GTPase-activating protein 4 isoform X2 [Anolis carolinensis]
MSAAGKARRERGSLAEYETQAKEMRWQMGEQVRGLDAQAESRQQLLQDVADFLRRKAEVEQEYSRGLEKLSERFSAKIRGSKEHQNFRKDQNLPSPLNCWYTILNQTRQASRDHGALSEIYTGHLALRLVHISEDVGRLARKSKEMEQQMQDELLKAISELQTAMKSYQTYRIDCLNAETKLREAERQEEKRSGGRHPDPGGSPGGIGLDKAPRRTSLKKVERLLEKRQSKFLESKLKCAKARNDYLLSLHSANSAISNYYVRDVADLLDCFDLGFHLSLGKVLRTYLAAESRAQASWQQGLCTIEGAVDALDPLGDKSRLMEANPAAYCPPLCFDYQPHEGDEVSEVRAEGPLRNELVSRFQHIQSRLNAITLETDEVNKTLKATLQSLLDLLSAEEPEALDAFQGCQSTESLKSTGSDAGGKQALAKRRANQQETESFYIMKFKEYLSGRSIQTKLQAKHDQMKEAIEKGAAVDRELARRRRLLARKKSSSQAVPLVVESCIRFINLHGLQHEGIFRVPGSQAQVAEIRNAFEKGEDPLSDSYTQHDLDSVAGVLKLYFRGLEKPLFPCDIVPELLATAQLESSAERISHLRALISHLPSVVLVVLRYLFAFLNHLSQYSDENMMDPHNLAVCFGPTLMTVPAGQDAVSVQPHINEVVKCLIVHQEAIFPGPSQLPGPQYEKVMALAEEEYCDVLPLEATAEEPETEGTPETPPSEDECDSQSEALPRSGSVVQQEERFVPQQRVAPVGWRRGERGGNRGLVPPIVLPDSEKQSSPRSSRLEIDTGSSVDELLPEPASRLRMNSDAGGGGRQRGSGGGNSPIRKLASPFMDGGRLPFPLLQPTHARTFHPTERPDRWGEISPRAWGGNNSEKQMATVDKEVARNMDSVFKELLGKTTLKHLGADEPLNHPEPPEPSKSISVGKKGSTTPAKQASSNRVLLRGRGVFKSSGNGE